jgi:hypothetical protein
VQQVCKARKALDPDTREKGMEETKE